MDNSLIINKIKFHAVTEDNDWIINPGQITVLVGPNNSGKSLALREIEKYCMGEDITTKVVGKIEINFPTDPDIAVDLLKKFETPAPVNQATSPGNIWVGHHTFNTNQLFRHYQVDLEHFKKLVSAKNTQELRVYLSSFYTLRLDGRTRFLLIDDKPATDLLSFPQNHLQALFVNDELRKEVNEIVREAFNLYFVIDPTSMGSFRIKLSATAPGKNVEQSLGEESRSFYKQAMHIYEFSDGVQAYIGLISAILSQKYKIYLIDEPEAFLHPPLAKRLGTNLSNIISKSCSNLTVSTHSSDFLIGCLQNAKDTSVIRLTYENGIATAKKMDSNELNLLMKDPLLRSTGSLRALFHRATIISESDTDRSFYEEINRRLENKQRGSRDTLFINSQNKQTISRIIKQLRSLGIPSVAIVDLDIIKYDKCTGKSSDLQILLQSCKVDPTKLDKLVSRSKTICDEFAIIESQRGGQGKELMKSQGIRALVGSIKQEAENMVNDLKEYGIFVVYFGELESWLSNLQVYGKGVDWLIHIFDKMGQNEEDMDYVNPANDDVWKFIDEISEWINNYDKRT